MAEKAGGIGGSDTSIYRQPEGPGMLDVAGKAMGLAQQNTNLQQSQFNLQQGKLQAINAQLGAAMADPVVQAGGPNGMKQLMSYAGKLVAMGHVSAKDLSAAMTGINQNNIMQGLKQYQLSALQAQQQLDAVQGGLQTINTGREQQLIRTPAYGAATPVPNGRFENQLTPGESVQPVAAPPDPNSGAPRQQPLAGFGVASGVLNPDRTMRSNPLMQQGAPQTTGNRLPVRQQPMPPNAAPAPTGNPAPQASAPSIPMPSQPERGVRQPGQVAQATNPYGTMTTGLPPGQAEAQRVGGEASGTQLAADMAHASKITQATYPVVQAITRLERLGPKGTGPGTEQMNQIKSFALSLGLPGFDANKIQDYDEAKKFLIDYVNRSQPASDARLTAAISGNPSTSISNAAAVDLSKSVVALERMRAAQAKAFQASGLPDSQYARWGAQWNATQDPRAYAIDVMGPEKFNKLRAELKGNPAALKRFEDSYAVAKQNGLVMLPTKQQKPEQQQGK